VDERAVREIGLAVRDAGERTGTRPLALRALSDHVHVLVSFRPDTCLSDFVRIAKSVSAFRANARVSGAVKWARGFYAATVHRNDLYRVSRYIRNQYQRHPDKIPVRSRESLQC
jgi:REP element-mobilizing transposase RayT